MLVEGRITKHHQVSLDRIVWTPVQDADCFRAECRTNPAPAPTTANYGAATAPVQNGGQGNAVADDGINREKLKLKPVDNESYQDRWYYAEDGQSAGPVTMLELRQLVDAGTIVKDCPICKEWEERWVKVGDAFPSLWKSGARYQAARFQVASAGRAHDVVYAGFWLRFVAVFIDGILVGLISVIPAAIVGALLGFQMGLAGADLESIGSAGQFVGGILQFFVGWLYFASTESSDSQATPGKRAMGLYVADMNGNRISFGQATGRYFGKILSCLLLGIGYLMAGITEKKQALHDMMAGTLVLKRAR
jgi:uncharacterized RDD family membrane protein YckC